MMRIIDSFVTLLFILQPVSGRYLNPTLMDFILYTNNKTWSDAQTFCREKHTDLITIRSEDSKDLVFVDNIAWIGLYRKNNVDPWKWSRGDEIASFFNWGPSEPQDNQHCVVKWNQKQKWVNDNCNRQRHFICVDERLVLVRENKTWEEALQHCRSLNEDNQNNQGYDEEKSFDLATLNTVDDQNFAREIAQQATTEEVWIGLRYLGDDWFWVGGEPVLYQNISSCPVDRCGVVEKNSSTLFGIRDCSQGRNFFCYKKLQPMKDPNGKLLMTTWHI